MPARQGSPSAPCSRLRRLEDRGLIRRKADQQDGRRALISLTAKGARLERKALEAHIAFVERFMAPFSQRKIEQIDDAFALLLDRFEDLENEEIDEAV